MKRFLLLFGLSLPLLMTLPSSSHAFWNSPQCCQGFGWLKCRALNSASFLSFHGPLYSYGPYNVPGYAYMYVPNPFCGSYVPAYPANYYGYPNPNAYANGFMSWNGSGVQLGYPNALNTSPSDYFSDGVLSNPSPTATPTSTSYYGGSAPGYFRQAPPSMNR